MESVNKKGDEMELYEINPNIRYCEKITKPHGARPVVAYDSRIFYLLSGTCTFTIAGEAMLLSESDLLYIPSGCPYRLEYDVDAPIELIIINFDFDQSHRDIRKPLATHSEDDFSIEKLIAVPEDLPFRSPIRIESFTAVQTLLLEAEKETARGGLFGREYASTLLRQILLEILRGKDQKANSEELLSERIRQYLNRHYTEDITAESLGVRFGYHPYHLNRIFKRHVGTTLRQYLIEQRIRAAKNLLLVTDLSVGDVAAAVGIPEQAYFSYCFKKSIGISPSEYRNKKGVRYL